MARGMEDLIMLAFAETDRHIFAYFAYVTRKRYVILSSAMFALLIVLLGMVALGFLLPIPALSVAISAFSVLNNDYFGVKPVILFTVEKQITFSN